MVKTIRHKEYGRRSRTTRKITNWMPSRIKARGRLKIRKEYQAIKDIRSMGVIGRTVTGAEHGKKEKVEEHAKARNCK